MIMLWNTFFAKLAAVLAQLNLLTKPKFIYNMDETGSSKVHKPRGNVLAHQGQKPVGSVTSEERGRIHTLLVCGSVLGHIIPPHDLPTGENSRIVEKRNTSQYRV